MKNKILFAWSGGKDSALALYKIRNDPKYEIAGLLTTLTEGYDRVTIHGVRRDLLERQAEYIGLPLEKVYIPKKATQEEYGSRMRHILLKYKALGIMGVVFGDIFLEDIKKYREENLAKIGMKAIFPLWKRDTTELAREFLGLGFRSMIACVDTTMLDKRFCGRRFDERFLSDLPPEVDPCGENGEFHSLVYDGPIFKEKIGHKTGSLCLREDRFYYCELTLG